jgi:hypothetical protein
MPMMRAVRVALRGLALMLPKASEMLEMLKNMDRAVRQK